MAENREERLERLFAEAVALPPEERLAFLEKRCGSDSSLRADLESLLANASEADGLFEREDGSAARAAERLTNQPEGTGEAEGDPLVGESVGPFQILEKLGGGGMGIVYKARDSRLDRLVALKFLPLYLSADDRARARLTSEARAASALDHPNLAVVHEIGEHRGQLFIAMAFYQGETLKKKLARGPLPVREALDYAAQIAEGLQRAHEAGIVHRDIKPANVLVTDRGQVKLVDFGIAKVPGESLTQTGGTVGTVGYMSPEQTGGEAVDHRTDLWSLGVLLYEMLAGERPFQGESVPAIVHAICDKEPEPLASRSPAIPAGLDGVLKRLLRKDPADRYQDADELLSHLRQLQESVAVQLPSAERSSWKLGKKPRWGSVAAVLLVVGALGVFLWHQAFDPERASPVQIAEAGSEVISLAVLPLENYSGDPEQEYFADGMTEELITTLAKIEGLRVIAHRSVRQFKDSDTPVRAIARLLGVQHMLDGSVLQEGDRVRITASLIDAETETSVWGERFERERRDVMALQREVALAITRQVEVALTPQDLARLGTTPAVDPEAFDLYVRGSQARYKFTPEDFEEAAEYFKQAISRDTAFAPPYAGLAWVLALRDQNPSRARQLAQRALELNPNLADAHVALGMIRQFHDWDWEGAEDAFRRAIQFNPGHAEAHHELSMLLMRLRRFDEALREARVALSLAPTSARFEQGVGEVYLFSGRYQDALAAARKARALDPSYSGSHWLLGMARAGLEEHKEAIEAFDRATQLGCGGTCVSALGHVYAVSGRREQALEVLEALTARWSAGEEEAVMIGTVYAGLGDSERALDWLERGVAKGKPVVYLAIDPALRSLDREPRFQALLERMGLDRNRRSEPTRESNPQPPDP